MNENKIELYYKTGKVEGYGGPGYWWIKVIYNNLLLQEVKSGSEFELGRSLSKLEIKWNKIIKKGADYFLEKIKNCKQASDICFNCGSNTIEGGSSIGYEPSRTYCYKKECQAALKEHQKFLYEEKDKQHKQIVDNIEKRKRQLEDERCKQKVFANQLYNDMQSVLN
jgi:hypothetical protein